MDELIKALRKNPHFVEFQKFVINKIDELNSIDDLKDLSNKKAGETVRVRAMAASKLQEILAPFVDFKEKREHTAEEINVAKKRAGL